GHFTLATTAPVAAAPDPHTPGLALTASPNPARGATTLAFVLPEAGPVTVSVFDALGRRVAALVDGPLGAGAHTLRLDTAALPAGVYVARVTAGTQAATHRLTVVR
ncbi:MAG TPA: T9SS type A sorting domain-containing protein, partial [Rhodothermales bacterium]|nr:T9SS type A sorting domain-containing protein [Rhodothermales bacterium]